jgi:hypothetical protein
MLEGSDLEIQSLWNMPHMHARLSWVLMYAIIRYVDTKAK